MKRIPIFGILILSAAIFVSAQKDNAPAFSQYPARVEKARVKAVDFGHNPDARTFKTRLSEGIRSGVNFAGHYVIVGWGCGTGCISGAIIDARNGNVFWPEQFGGIGVWYGASEYADEPVKYKKNSRLLVIKGSPGVKNDAAEKPQGEYYYEWNGSRLKLIKLAGTKMQQ